MSESKTALGGLFSLAQQYSEMWNICSELAESDPIHQMDVDGVSYICAWCDAGNVRSDMERVSDRLAIYNDHRPGCIWRRSKRLVENE